MARGMACIAIAAVAICLAPGLPPNPAPAADAQQVTLTLNGMTCASCAFAIKAALKKLDGVQEAKVSYREERATIIYDPDRVSPEAMIQAIRDAGFDALTTEPTETPQGKGGGRE